MWAPRSEPASQLRLQYDYKESQTPVDGSPEQTSNPGVQPSTHRHVTHSVEVGLLQPLVAHFAALHATLSL